MSFALIAPVFSVQACSIAVDDGLPTTAKEFKSAGDVVLASIQASSVTKELYESDWTKRSGEEILTLKIEKVYKGDRKIGDIFTLVREYGSGSECLNPPLFRHLGIQSEDKVFYTSYEKPSLLLFLKPSFVDGSNTGYVERESDYVYGVLGYPEKKEDSSLALNDMVDYSDALLKHLSKVEPGLTDAPTPSSEETKRIVLMQQLIVLLTQYIQLLGNK